MTIIVAGNTGKEIYFSYDAAVGNRHGLFDTVQKVSPIADHAVIGFAGYPEQGVSVFSDQIASHPEHTPLKIIQSFVNLYGQRLSSYVSFLFGTMEQQTPHLYAFDRKTDYMLKEVFVHGIGSGIYPEIEQELAHISGNMNKALDAIVAHSKELDRTRMNILYGSGSGVLTQNGWEYLSYKEALGEYLEKIRTRTNSI